ncbi:hypothetical protein [Bradyrhizobium sp.]|uniref:hypothetical protein n=1 Tax=Bradyrhizobium sp. TaxID=376 RepID=UPI0039E441B8
MTVATEASYAELLYTGVETVFPPGFSAQDAADVQVGYFDTDGLLVPLIAGTHFIATLDASGAVTVTRVAFPYASPSQPVRIAIERVTPATQGVDFDNLEAFDASVHERLADAAAMRDAELRNRQARTVTPFTGSNDVVDFRPRRVRAADPVESTDLATKFYADEVSGSNAQAAAEAARDIAVSAASTATTQAGIATGAAGLAATYAAMLGNPDYQFYTDATSTSRDYGTYV